MKLGYGFGQRRIGCERCSSLNGSRSLPGSKTLILRDYSRIRVEARPRETETRRTDDRGCEKNNPRKYIR